MSEVVACVVAFSPSRSVAPVKDTRPTAAGHNEHPLVAFGRFEFDFGSSRLRGK